MVVVRVVWSAQEEVEGTVVTVCSLLLVVEAVVVVQACSLPAAAAAEDAPQTPPKPLSQPSPPSYSPAGRIVPISRASLVVILVLAEARV